MAMPNSSKTLQSSPPKFSEKDFFAGVHWHQKWEVFQDIFTPGENPVDKLCDYVRLPNDLSGKRVLDIGAWNGCFSFECERREASEVVAYSLENPNESGFNRLKEILNSKVSYVQGSVYSLSPDTLGKFDLILFFGVLYHLRYPLLAIDRIRTVCEGTVLTETHILNNRLFIRHPFTTIGRLLNFSSLFKGTPIWRQYKEYELHPEDRSNWFGPNIQAVLESFDSAGFDTIFLKSWNGDRASFKANIKNELPERLISGSYEGLSSSNSQLAGIPHHQVHLYEDETR